MTNLLEALDRVLNAEVTRRCQKVIAERNAFEAALAERFVKEGRTFVKGPYRMANPDETIPSNNALRQAMQGK